MSRFAFNFTCSVLTIAGMTGFLKLLSYGSTAFIDGFALGMFVAILSLWLCHKMGARIF